MTFKILSAEFSHETNTFNVCLTTLADFANDLLLDGDKAIAQRGNKNTQLAGLLDVGAEHHWQIEHCFSASAGPGGKVTKNTFDEILNWFDKNNIEFIKINSIDGDIISKLVNLIYVLDYASIYLAIINKIDPTPVNSIDYIKKRL